METEVEEVVPQEEAQPLSAEEIAELKRKAEVSSQNFERAKKAETSEKLLTARIQELESQLSTNDYIDPNDVIQNQLAEFNAKLAKLEEDRALAEIFTKYPALKDKQSEFDTYRQSYPAGSNLEPIAKLFMAENDMLETPKRKGLEKAGGGQRVVPTAGMTQEDIQRLRTSNWKEYTKLVREGKIK